MATKAELLDRVKRGAGCQACMHWRGLTCTAFPRGIPSDIQSGQVAHDRPYPGDGNVQWDLNREWARENAPGLLEEV